MTTPLFNAALQLGDDCLILAQRLCEWSGSAPTIEVDLSLSNIGLDLLGQRRLDTDTVLEPSDAIDRMTTAPQIAFGLGL